MANTQVITMYKNKLQEYTQKLNLPLPAYRTANEGFQHAPKFRCTVFVDGAEYTSKFTFHRLREAEQDAAKLAYDCIISNAKQHDFKPLLDQEPKSSKLILHEFTFKKLGEFPKYKTLLAEGEGSLPVFVSTVTVGDKTFTGAGAKSKRLAEQFVARTALQSLLGTKSGADLNQMMSSKRKHYGAPINVTRPWQYKHKKLDNMGATGPRAASQEKRSIMPLKTAPHFPNAATPARPPGFMKQSVAQSGKPGNGRALQRANLPYRSMQQHGGFP